MSITVTWSNTNPKYYSKVKRIDRVTVEYLQLFGAFIGVSLLPTEFTLVNTCVEKSIILENFKLMSWTFKFFPHVRRESANLFFTGFFVFHLPFFFSFIVSFREPSSDKNRGLTGGPFTRCNDNDAASPFLFFSVFFARPDTRRR